MCLKARRFFLLFISLLIEISYFLERRYELFLVFLKDRGLFGVYRSFVVASYSFASSSHERYKERGLLKITLLKITI